MTFGTPLGQGRFTVRLANSGFEIAAAQKLRHRVFFAERSHPSKQPSKYTSKYSDRDHDPLDHYCDHLIVLDNRGDDRIVGVSRLIRQRAARQAGNFYSAGAYDLTPLLSYPGNLLELGRSCIDPAYRDGAASRLLWKGLSRYIAAFDIDLIFGCASLPGTRQGALAESLSYLYHHHTAPASLRPRALPPLHVAMDRIPHERIDEKQAFLRLPPLIKAYLRIGCGVGDGAVIDHHFETTDVLVVARTDALKPRYRLMGLAPRKQRPPPPASPILQAFP